MSSKKKLNESVLAEGEVTGHAHRLPTDIEVYEDTENGNRFFDTDTDVELTHEEHGTLTIPAGGYASGKVTEYDPFEKRAREVAD